MLFKAVLTYIFLEIYGLQTNERIGLKRCELQGSNMEEMLTVDIFQKHTHPVDSHTHATTHEIDCFLQESDCNICQLLGAVSGMFSGGSYFCTRLVRAHYSWWGEENLKKQMHSVVWSQNSEPIISSLIFILEAAYFLSSTFCHYCLCMVELFFFRLQLLYSKNAKTGVRSEPCIPKTVSTYTPIRINHTISMFVSWQTVIPNPCILYKIIHQADDGGFTAQEMRRCCLTTWLGSTGWGDLSVGAGAHVWSGAETISTWTPADRCKEEHDTRSNNIKMSSVRCKIK